MQPLKLGWVRARAGNDDATPAPATGELSLAAKRVGNQKAKYWFDCKKRTKKQNWRRKNPFVGGTECHHEETKNEAEISRLSVRRGAPEMRRKDEMERTGAEGRGLRTIEQNESPDMHPRVPLVDV